MAAALLRHLADRRIYVESAGVRPGEPDPFAIAAMDEIGIDISDHVPRGWDDLHDLSFDRIITLSPEAQHKALALAQGYAIEVDYWPAPDPTLATGAREQILVRQNHGGICPAWRRRRLGPLPSPEILLHAWWNGLARGPFFSFRGNEWIER